MAVTPGRSFSAGWVVPNPNSIVPLLGGDHHFSTTIDRAARLCQRERIVTLIAREHQGDAWSQLDGRTGVTVLLQPRNRETAAGMYLPLTYIRARDPHATVVFYPSDHFVYPEHRFLDSCPAGGLDR